MLTKLSIRNFKRLKSVEIELGSPVVFIGPNNSGKTTALQALTLWDLGLRRWNERREGQSAPEKRPGVAINRRDLVAVPIRESNLLWHDRHVRDSERTDGKTRTTNVCIEIVVEGVSGTTFWKCGLEFDYANEESLYCRPLRLGDTRMSIPKEAGDVHVALLPPMSGLSDREFAKERGEIDFLIGQGRTAEVLRNLAWQLCRLDDGHGRWNYVRESMKRLFRVELREPEYIQERSEITMSYRESSGITLDLSSSGKGFQQTLLLLLYIVTNPHTVLLLDEPDAHLEILRQREIYNLLSETSRNYGCQVIAASHSEVILNEAADRDTVIAFVGKPHRIDDRGDQIAKSLREIGFDQYYEAEQNGWVLYLEGSTDLAILRSFAERLKHPVFEQLERPFVCYVANQPEKARSHFFGLREGKSDLTGILICDQLSKELQTESPLMERMWSVREIENHLFQPETLLAYAQEYAVTDVGDLFKQAEAERWCNAMNECIADIYPKMAINDRKWNWWSSTKASDEVLDPLFKVFFKKLDLPNLMRKTDYHVLARYVPKNLIHPEIRAMLDSILDTASKANPRDRSEV